jgi:3-hydroxybutyrate dehydrogenase
MRARSCDPRAWVEEVRAVLNGRCAVVTGSVAGLGLAMAEGLADAGASIVLNGLCATGVGEAAADMVAAQHGVTAVFDPADLRRAEEIERMIRGAEERFGAVDILVNSAVVRHFSPVEGFDPAGWDESIAVNLTAAFHTIRLALPGMKRKGWGRIVNVSSYYGWRGAENRIDYVTTKTALIGMTRAVAIETARTGVTCNAICPGTVLTPAIEQRIAAIARERGEPVDEVSRRYASERNPMGRFVSTKSIAGVLVFLCGPAGDDMTGTVIPVDGGWLAA